MANPSKARGTAWESAICEYIRGIGPEFSRTERRTLGGANDKGDISVSSHLVIEAKAEKSYTLAGYVAEAETERDNAGAWLGVAWLKRVGKTNPGAGYVVMSGEQFGFLLAALRKAKMV